jgi:hypothetical protein
MNGAENNVEAPNGSTNCTWVERLAPGVAALVLIAFRLHAFNLPLEADECNYAYIGVRLLAGDRMYVDVWDHQPWGVFLLFAGVIALFGGAPEAFRWTAVLFSLVSLLLVFAILRRVAGRGAAVSGAILFAIASSDPGTAGEGCNREIYMATLILTAWYCVLRRPEVSNGGTFLAGCALALASAIKTIVAVHWLFLAAWMAATTGLGTGEGNRSRHILGSLLLFALGPVVLWVGSFAYFGATGRLNEFVDAVFLFNLSYSGAAESFLARFAHFFAPQRHPFIFDSALPLWIGGIAAGVLLTIEVAARRGKEAAALLLLVLSTYITVCLPARFWPHYYYLLIPVLSVAVPAALGRLLDRLHGSVRVTPAVWRWSTVAVLSLFPLLMFPAESHHYLRFGLDLPDRLKLLLPTKYRDYLSQPPFGITVKRYNSRDFWGRAQGENVRRVTEPNDTVFVFGNDPEIYYYSGRRCASRFTMITGLQSGFSGAQRRRETLIAELKEHPPRLIVVLFDEPPFAEWAAFLREYYGEPIGWDFHDRSGDPIMFVLARKDRPVESINWDWDRSEVGGWMLGEKR